jgi:preprotein translocase subunit SecD
MLSHVLAVALLAAGSPPSDRLPSCKVSVYAIDHKGQRSKQPFLASSDFSSVTDAGPGIGGNQSWRFVLTAKGKAINAGYSKSHLGEKVAIYCGAREILRPTIAGPSSGEFVIESP